MSMSASYPYAFMIRNARRELAAQTEDERENPDIPNAFTIAKALGLALAKDPDKILSDLVARTS